MLDRFDGYPDPDRPRIRLPWPVSEPLREGGVDVMDAAKEREEGMPLAEEGSR